MKEVIVCICLVCVVSLVACVKAIDSSEGFSLPQGDPENGKLVFLNNNCLSCHSIDGVSDVAITREREPAIVLGTSSAVVTTYAQLVTSIINPSHRISRASDWQTSDPMGHSLMRNYNDILTVSELIDLVAYLQPHYKVKPLHIPTFSDYEKLLKDKLETP
jgi:sulfur-oxidizing protein SoxX